MIGDEIICLKSFIVMDTNTLDNCDFLLTSSQLLDGNGILSRQSHPLVAVLFTATYSGLTHTGLAVLVIKMLKSF